MSKTGIFQFMCVLVLLLDFNPSGVYLVAIEVGDYYDVRKMLLVGGE